MSAEKGGSGALIWGGLLLALVIYSCTEEEPPVAEEHQAPAFSSSGPPDMGNSAEPLELPPPAPPPPPPPPPHNYESVEDGIYYYLAAVSEDDRKNGFAAPKALGFRYYGRNSAGEDELLHVGSQLAYCRRPCKIIRYSNGERIGFDEGTVIGAAFADVARGYLKKYSPPKPESEPAEPVLPQVEEVAVDDVG